jgi:hypothetical protein
VQLGWWHVLWPDHLPYTLPRLEGLSFTCTSALQLPSLLLPSWEDSGLEPHSGLSGPVLRWTAPGPRQAEEQSY